MTLLRIEAVLPYDSGNPEDVAINVFHVWTPEPTALEDYFTALGELFTKFYTGLDVTLDQTGVLANYMSKIIDLGAVRLDLSIVSDWDTTSPDFVPVGSLPIADWGEVGSISLPLETSIVSSLRGRGGPLEWPGHDDIIAPTPIARRRGRFYWGPLNIQCLSDESDARPGVDPTVRDDLAKATEALVRGIKEREIGGDPEQMSLVIYSRAGLSLSEVVQGHVNNEFDTQRRREVGEWARSSWSLS